MLAFLVWLAGCQATVVSPTVGGSAGVPLAATNPLPPPARRSTPVVGGVSPVVGDQPAPAKSYRLQVAEHWLLNAPNGERFDASALLRTGDGRLLTVNDKGPGLYRIEFRNDYEADLIRDPAWFTPAQLSGINAGKIAHWDLEGLGRDEAGRIYVCEELNRWVIRADPATGRMERLDIDWTPVRKWFSSDLNSSWEGIAVGTDGRLYLANERDVGRIVVVDQKTLRVVDDFQVLPVGVSARNVHYSDLNWFEGQLWVLCRQSQRVVQVDPATHRVVADFDYNGIEFSAEYGYATVLPYGQYEGLSVDANSVWLVIDNNGSGRSLKRGDTRPTLFRCARPDRTP